MIHAMRRQTAAIIYQRILDVTTAYIAMVQNIVMLITAADLARM
jgi:hypothetical protein